MTPKNTPTGTHGHQPCEQITTKEESMKHIDLYETAVQQAQNWFNFHEALKEILGTDEGEVFEVLSNPKDRRRYKDLFYDRDPVFDTRAYLGDFKKSKADTIDYLISDAHDYYKKWEETFNILIRLVAPHGVEDSPCDFLYQMCSQHNSYKDFLNLVSDDVLPEEAA